MKLVLRYYYYTLAFIPLIQLLFYEFIGKSFVLLYGFIGTVIFFYWFFLGKKFRIPKYILPLFFFALYHFGWDLVNDKVFSNKAGIITYLYSNLWLHTITFLVLVYNTSFDKKFIDNILRIFRITIILAFLASIIQQFIDPFFMVPDDIKATALEGDQYNFRLPSIFGYIKPAEIGISYISIISIMIGYYLYKKKNLHFLWILLAGISFFVNKSRYIYLNFVVILLQYPLVKGLQLSKMIKYVSIGAVFLMITIFVLKSEGFEFEKFIESRLLSKSASTRLLAVEMFNRFFPKQPFFGSGVHVSDDLRRAIAGRSSQIHVGYLSSLYEFGLIGSAFLFGFWYMVERKLLFDAKRTGYYGSAFAFITFLLTNLTSVVYSIYSYGLLLAFIFNKHINDLQKEKGN